ncbi:uncharacterized protein SETTUDRAFT_105409 [Exserohilum turcica Et28A]|uniref:Uncharacterized protein n=1 Tax=Exserohilum turcicum (strain 28A) TaxID=671987 RepID=R0IWH2_EXST2|nr:uncharacterized protein SETTUDRAFT_105409 [Exserohilum turcica Et28A]EOA89105.1 hypothetical protein SETTUDRAFT_105409 [Exserohilum turcica Et28A]
MARRIPGRTAPLATLHPTTARNQCLCPDPWVSHQDDIVVNSVEAGTVKRRAGVGHYLHKLSLVKGHAHICIDIDEYRRNRPSQSDSPVAGDEEGEVKQEDYDNNNKPEYGCRYFEAPIPPHRKEEYNFHIYKCTATNPAIFLAIARLAQRNLRFMNFDSAINHLPNLHPTSRLPKLQPNVTAEKIPHDQEEGFHDPVTIIFLPSFYHDGRHAVGYYTFSPPNSNRALDKSKALMRGFKQILFTPCNVQELEDLGLIAYEPCVAGQSPSNKKQVQSIGAAGGKWFRCEVVEEWDDWSESFEIVARVWQRRLEMCNPKSFGV